MIGSTVCVGSRAQATSKACEHSSVPPWMYAEGCQHLMIALCLLVLGTEPRALNLLASASSSLSYAHSSWLQLNQGLSSPQTARGFSLTPTPKIWP